MPDLSFTVEFAEAQAPDVVTRRGLIFRPGAYADKGFVMTADEVAAAAADFSPVPLDLEHRPSILDGKLGTLAAVELKGDELHGDVEIPRWLHDVLGPDPLKVSCAWDRNTKRLQKLALVQTPRVTDAALMSAYAEFAGRRHSASDLTALQQIHDLAQGQGAECRSTADYSHDAHEGKETHMSETEKTPSPLTQFWAWLNGGKVPEGEQVVGMSQLPPPMVAVTGQPDPEVARLREELDRVQKERAEERRQAHLRQAAAFADAEIAASRAVPAERAEIASAYFQAAQDDAAAPTMVTFADGKTGTRVEGLTRLHAARPAHGYTQELVGDPSLVALFNRETTEEADSDAALVKSIGEYADRMNGRKGGGS